MRATALLILLAALIGLSYQQDTVGLNVCPTAVATINAACLSTSFGFVDSFDLTDSTFCADGFLLTQCLDGSCISSATEEALRLVIPQLFRPNVCPICSDIPFILESSRKVCTAFGLNHVVAFDKNPYFCFATALNGTEVLLATNFITLTALTSATEPGFFGVRFDYHGCIVFSKTWYAKDVWETEKLPTAGWFPHTVRITQNATQVSIALAALNTDIIIHKNGRYLAVTVGYGVRSSLTDLGVCVSASTCAPETFFVMPSPTTPPCTQIPIMFATGCQFDLLTKNSSDLSQNAYNAALTDSALRTLQSNATVLQELDFQRRGLPVVLTVVPTGAFVAMYVGLYFWRKRVIRRRAETMSFSQTKGCCNQTCLTNFSGRYRVGYNQQTERENLLQAPIRAIWCWMVFCLNSHGLGLVYSFTGLVLLSMFCGVWIFWYLAKNSETIFYNSRFSVASIIIYKVMMSLVLVQQAGIGIIGVVAYEYWLYEVQFWWGIAVLIFMFIAAFWMMIVGLNISIAASYLLKGNAPKPRDEVVIAMRPIQQVEQRRPGIGMFFPQAFPDNQNHVINVQPQQQHVIPNAMQIQQGVQVSDQVIPPPQAHVMQGQPGMNMQVSDNVIPPPQAHVMQPQPDMYGNGLMSPPDSNPYIKPAPVDMIPGYGSVNITANMDQSDPCHRVAKRTIKMAALDLDPSREEQICQKIMEMMQSMGVVYTLRGEDGEAASLRNDLAKNLAEEVRMYKNDSMEELSYGLKEAILLWKDEHKIT